MQLLLPKVQGVMGNTDSAMTQEVKQKRGLTFASKETRLRVATLGGLAERQKRGLAAASPETRARVASLGGQERAKDIEGLTEAGRKGGELVKERYGKKFYHRIGLRGGGVVAKKYGKDYFAAIGKEGGSALVEKHGTEHMAAIGRIGGKQPKKK